MTNKKPSIDDKGNGILWFQGRSPYRLGEKNSICLNAIYNLFLSQLQPVVKCLKAASGFYDV